MSDVFGILQERYQVLLARQEDEEVGEEFLDDVKAFIVDAQQAGAGVAELRERSQIRAWIRFLADVLYDATGTYPDVTLQPLARGHLVHPQHGDREKAPPPHPLVWMLTGAAAAVLVAAGLVFIGWRSLPQETGKTGSEIPTPSPAPFVSHVAVGTSLDTAGALHEASDTFCMGTREIVAELAIEDIQPDTQWRWEVRRDGAVVAKQPPAPWGTGGQQVTVRALTGGAEGVEPGQYELLVYAGDQVVGVRTFCVLDTPPRAFNLRVADVPEPAVEASTQRTFEPGVRVIYLSYDFEGFCPGLDLSHTLHHEGQPIQERVEQWSGASQGQAQVSFQALDDQPLPTGEYEVVTAVASTEPVRVELTITEAKVEPKPPAFGDVTIALGMQPDGTPVLTTLDNRFDWNTKVVYGIFDYLEMSDGLSWAAVWRRNGQEVAREEQFWDVEADGIMGTRWVTYHDPRGQVLPGGTYSVTLYIDSVAQHTADFNITYYVPPE